MAADPRLADVAAGASAVTQRSAHRATAKSVVCNSRPLSVRAYSTRMGGSGNTVRETIASRSSSRSRSDSIRSLMSPTALRRVENRDGPAIRTCSTAPVHREPTSSIAR